MNNKKRVAVIIIILLLILNISASVIGILYTPSKEGKKEEPKIPKITEDYKEVELISKYKSENNIYYNNITTEIEEKIDDKEYIIGSNGTLYDKFVLKEDNSIEEEQPIVESKDYAFYSDYEEDEYYYINNKTKQKSKLYSDVILPKKDELVGIYAVLISYDEDTDKNTYEILNTSSGKITKIDNNDIDIRGIDIFESNEYEYSADSINYFKVTNKTEKYGLIDHEGNIVIDIIYDSIEIFEDKYIIVSINNKYGIIDFKNQTIVPFEYDSIYSYGKYIILEQNNKISIADSNAKIYIDNKIETSENSISNNNITDVLQEEYSKQTLYTTVINNKLYLQVYNNNKNSIYLINNKGIERKISSNNDFFILDNEYIYTVEKNDKAKLVFYDLDLYEYFKMNLDINQNIQYLFDIDYLNDNYIKFELYHEELEDINIKYYIDLFNSKEIDERTALKTYFKNGYNFYISSDNKLKIYKNDELLNEFDGEYRYLGGYLFIKNNEIFEVIFKKDSTTR